MDNLDEKELDELYQEYVLEDQDVRLLKAMVSDEAVAEELSNAYDSSLFMGSAQEFAQQARSYYVNYGTLPTRRVMLELADSSKLDEINYIWDAIDQCSYSKSEFAFDLEKIKDRHTKHKVLSIKKGIAELDENADYVGALKKIKSEIEHAEKIRAGIDNSFTQKTMREFLPEFRDEFVLKSKNPELGQGVLTGYSYMDYVTNGLIEADLLIIGGETGAGKSIMLNNLALNMWLQGSSIDNPEYKKGYNVQYFSLEMPYKQCFRRSMARLSSVPSYALRSCQITEPAPLERLAKAARLIKNSPWEFDIVDIPRGVTVKDIEARFLDAENRGYRPDVVVVDYLGLMNADGVFGDDWLKIGEIAGQLHEFARVYKVPVLTAVQLNRPKGKDPSDIIGLHRIGRSSQIMHHASIGIQIETRQDEDTYPDLIYHLIKCRDGERGQHLLKKDFRCASLTDLAPYVPQIDDAIGNFSSVAPAMDDISSHLEGFGWIK